MKFLSLLSIIFLLSACGSGSGTPSRSQATLTERGGDNDQNSTAQAVEINNIISGSLNIDSDDKDIYSFEITEQKMFDITLSGPMGTDYDLLLADSSGGYIAASESYESEEEISITLAPGKYYIEVETYDGSGAYILSIFTGSASVNLDQGPVCLEFNNLSQGLATELSNDMYDRGQCSAVYKYRCEFEAEGLEGLIFYTSVVSYSDAAELCDDYSGRLIIM